MNDRAASNDAANAVLVEHQGGGVTIVTLNRPHVLNALNTEMGLRLGEAMDAIAELPSVRVVILTGAGDRAFSVGGDLKERSGMTPDEWVRQHRIFEAAANKIRWLRKPIFTAVNGYAVGGGCEYAMNTDFIVAGETARFGQPEVTRGIMPGAGGTQWLPRRIPRGRALELLFTGEMIDAHEALALGLVNRVVPPPELMSAALEIARRIAANSPAAVQQTKRSVRLGVEVAIEHGIEIELECYQRMVGHPDRYEGVAAFNERRTPSFRDAH